VAIAVARGIRTFFLQPFKIPTGSMQPTLYGVTHEDLRGRTDVKIPNGFARFVDYWFNGVSYIHIVAKSSGTLTWDPPSKFVLFNRSQTYRINGVANSILFPPDGLFDRSEISPGAQVEAGKDIVKLRVISGDHLFVDRVSYNFRRPQRGDIVVFETHGIQGIADMSRELADTYYIKRLCGLGGERLALTRDYEIRHQNYGEIPVGHLVINGTREITASTPHFEYLYTFPDAVSRTNKMIPFHENHYVGHALLRNLAPGAQFEVRPNCYFVMGDNTLNSSDSRYWGDFERNKVIGKSFFVYWPIGKTSFKGEERDSRFGWAHR
jgi:signal peptidase I